MRIYHENHRKSPHRINVFYPLFSHYKCKSTKKWSKCQRKFVFSATYCYLCGMKERINWIDWAKALAVITVIFCHLPQSQEWFYYRYLQSVTIVIFFFLSGYLKKDYGSKKENWRKYWHGLILPYIIYNAIVYPYWYIKFYLLNDRLPDLFSAIRPIFGALLFEHENTFCEPLNGPLWYLPAILIMHITVDLTRKSKHQHLIIFTLCILSFILYAANKYWYFAPKLTPMGLMRNLPYYYIGLYFRQYCLFKDIKPRNNLFLCIFCLLSSILLFVWHLQAFYAGQHMLHIVLFYPVNIGFLFGVLYGCKLLDGIKLSFITNLSIGTLVIIGLHIILVALANYTLEHLLHLNTSICYHWYEALPIALIITTLLYPVILFSKHYMPILIGRKKA